jgi:ephrin-B
MAVLIKKCSLILPGFRTTSCLTVVLLVCMETVFLCTQSTCSKTFHVHWNTTDSIFRIDNTDHIIDVNKGNAQFEYDQVNIICPVYTPGTYGDDLEKYIIYNVSKEEYETCRITNPNPRIIAICDKPYKLMYFTITFRPFTPQPGGLEFLPGKDYYFICK